MQSWNNGMNVKELTSKAGKARWKGTTKAERRAHAMKMVEARRKKKIKS
jgi:hypothetical protein